MQPLPHPERAADHRPDAPLLGRAPPPEATGAFCSLSFFLLCLSIHKGSSFTLFSAVAAAHFQYSH